MKANKLKKVQIAPDYDPTKQKEAEACFSSTISGTRAV